MIYGSTTPLQSVGELSDMGYHLVFRPLSGKHPHKNSAGQACWHPEQLVTALLLQIIRAVTC